MPAGRVVHVIDSLVRAGAQRVLADVVEGLAERGWEQVVAVLNPIDEDAALAAEIARRAVIVRIGKWRIATGMGLVPLYREIARADVVHTLLPISDLLGRCVARMAHSRATLTVLHARNEDKSRFHLLLDRLTMRWASRVGGVSQTMKAFAMGREGVTEEQWVDLPNGVQVPDRRIVPAHLNLPPGARVLVSLGRLAHQKGFDVLIRAMDIVVRMRPDVFLCIAGAGPLEGELKDSVRSSNLSDHVRFLGQRSDPLSVMAAAELYVQASRFEGMPISVMEAMAAGIPVVCTNVDGVRQLIGDRVHGRLVERENAEMLAATIVDLLDRPAEARSLASAARQRIQQHFSKERMIERYDAVLREIARLSRN